MRAYIDKPDGVNIGDCENVSRALSDALDAEDYITPCKREYMVEFASGTESAGHRADHPLACLHPCKDDESIGKIAIYIENVYGLQLSQPRIIDMLKTTSKERGFNPVHEFIQSATWDNVEPLH